MKKVWIILEDDGKIFGLLVYGSRPRALRDSQDATNRTGRIHSIRQMWVTDSDGGRTFYVNRRAAILRVAQIIANSINEEMR